MHLISTTVRRTSCYVPAFDANSNSVESFGLLGKYVERGIWREVFLSSGTVYSRLGSPTVSVDAPTAPKCIVGITEPTIGLAIQRTR
jgi:hypothetical protein